MAETLAALRFHANCLPGATAFYDVSGMVSRAQLLSRVGAVARQVAPLQGNIGVLGTSSAQDAILFLGCLWAGKTVVFLPTYFSPTQLNHLLLDAEVRSIVATAPSSAEARLEPAALVIDARREEVSPPPLPEAWHLITYSSGTTGTPKGALLGSRQIDRIATSLARAVGANTQDRYLSVLPLALLLEQVAAVHVPLLVGATSAFSPSLPLLAFRGAGDAIADAIEAEKPTILSLVPEVLAAWIAALRRTGSRAPASLRFVAIGGAPLLPGLARSAEHLGIPIHEGYGLTECGSVVALNRAGDRRSGTVGRALDGVNVEIENGEIVVRGGTVMDGYLRGDRAEGVWRTGDIGSFDAKGYLIVEGRKDSMIVTSLGRNIHPEWIESMLLTDPRVAMAVLCADGGPWPVAIVEPSVAGLRWLSQTPGASPMKLVEECTTAAPEYARPHRVILAADGELRTLYTLNGRPRRSAIASRFLASPAEVVGRNPTQIIA